MNILSVTHSDEALCAALALLHVPEAGPLLLKRLHQHFGGVVAMLNAGFEALQALGVKHDVIAGFLNPAWGQVENDLRWQRENEGCILHFDHPLYPPLLREMHAPPFVLFVKGDCALLSQPQLAMVGSRTPTPMGRDNAFAFAKSLAPHIIITSGLALGVDGASHLGALAANEKTIAVMGTGLESLYPLQHMGLAHTILEKGGAWVSEFAPNVGVSRDHFPRRNRIISGLSLGTLVVEAAMKSGSLITARYALENGREVFALPGSIHNPLARGCHYLITQGAKLVETAEDVLNELRISVVHQPSSSASIIVDNISRLVLAHIEDSPTTVDAIIAGTALSAPVVTSILLALELQGLIKNAPGGVQATAKKYQLIDL